MSDLAFYSPNMPIIFNVIKALCLIHKKPLSKDSFEVVNGPNKRVTFDEEDQENLYKLVQALRDPEIDQSRLFFTRKDVDLDGAGKLRRAEIAQDWESRKIKQLELVVSRLRRTSLRRRSMERVGGGRNMRRREKSSSEMKGVDWKDTNPYFLNLRQRLVDINEFCAGEDCVVWTPHKRGVKPYIENLWEAPSGVGVSLCWV
ncbi:hypothetical protein QJS04_geneDACA020368 [Acorus gramineus]|uniref:Uncharacterized protein n=1 Tax=Acorus gramineus TaxID=55184 RepID=A0AAV9A306_ACOGR|nr:hypothetical protein QJS04_geneDACA020368 [Acorus gramineus]